MLLAMMLHCIAAVQARQALPHCVSLFQLVKHAPHLCLVLQLDTDLSTAWLLLLLPITHMLVKAPVAFRLVTHCSTTYKPRDGTVCRLLAAIS